MTASRPTTRLLILVGLAIGLAGCHAVDFYRPTMQQPVPPPLEPPRELSMMSLASYRVEPPDLLSIEMLKLVPLPPYRVDIFDVLQIHVTGTLPQQPIDNYFLVEAEGIVTLGPAYGTVRVAGMTIEEATAAITRKLQGILSNPDVAVQLARTAGTAPVTGDYLVGPDGTINLKEYGTLAVAGKTVSEIRLELQNHLSQYFDSPLGGRRGEAIQQQGVLRDYGGGRPGRQHPPRADHGQRHGAGRLERGQRPLAGIQRADLGRPAGAGRIRLRADHAGRLRLDGPGRFGGDELPVDAGRPGIHCRRQPRGLQQLPQQVGQIRSSGSWG